MHKRKHILQPLKTLPRAGLVLLMAGLLAAPVRAQDSALIVTATKIQQFGAKAHIEIELSGAAAAHAFLLENPDRIIIDLPQVSFQGDTPKLKARDGLIKDFRYGLFAAGQSRIVMDLAAPVKLVSSHVESGTSGKTTTRLTLDLQKTDRKSFHAAVEPDQKLGQAAPELRPSENGALPQTEAPKDQPLPLIVIDPGHGGPDSGAIGIGGIVEKTTVFAFANVLKARIEATHRYRVMLTRDQDVFVPLGERMRIARAANAALFLSLHADTLSAEQGVAGATVYTVSDRASDAEAARVAAHENQADLAGGLAPVAQAPEVADILFDLTRRETRSYAHVFSKSLVNAWKSGPFLSLNKNPQRSAGFVVLKAPDVPSVLLEMGYLSSAKDVKALVSDEWRNDAAKSVLAAIDSFFANRSTSKKVENTAETVDMTPTSSIPATHHP